MSYDKSEGKRKKRVVRFHGGSLSEMFYVMKEITMEEKSTQRINSVARAIQILELYPKLNAQYLGVSEISKHWGCKRHPPFIL